MEISVLYVFIYSGHAGVSPHSEADILQKMQLPDLPLRDFCPQLSVPLRLVRQHIRENLRATVVKEVETRGDASTTGCMRGTLAARFGSLRRWLKGLSNPQQEIVWSVMSGDGRAAARLLETTVGADYIRCGVCDGKVSSCVVMREAHESQPIDSRVALAHDEAPFVAIEEAAAGLENADPGPGPPPSGILLEEADPDGAARACAESIDAFRTRAPAADATQDVGLPLAPALRRWAEQGSPVEPDTM
eukprot:g12807.t1